ncbi:hypothetical protein AGABI1DRAFT_129725 [Agaricus bisporus var. burnettii JB137-S8]|uniref:RING-type domain-containing protein n=1 Tax=Agaricus bisporus var. burnettii (strain JB137-S8 / ATCC MYA-4627 / FGSC 10392) TaxID=597362 RepID=K5VTZ3_AGABU|nr:uncharacterized protein AGABI1DRAFT_129725 [Agaricus bisporus var. burnettii JB137-S8]EKM77934.1 hypothetical protein AGABI1DRAFT_129725 [Agaricus bisporus var. burnettii JB137-S8]
MPRTTRSQTKKSSSSIPISPSTTTQPESITVSDPSSSSASVSLPLPPPTTTRTLRPRALRGTSKTSSVLSSASSSVRRRGRGASRSSNLSRDSSVLSSAVGDSDGRATTMVEATGTTTRGRKHRMVEVPQTLPEHVAGPIENDSRIHENHDPTSPGPPRPDWRNWEEYDDEEGFDQLREDDYEEESQVARQLEQTTSSSSQMGTPHQQNSSERSTATSNTMTSSSPMVVAVANPCSPTPTKVTQSSTTSRDHSSSSSSSVLPQSNPPDATTISSSISGTDLEMNHLSSSQSSPSSSSSDRAPNTLGLVNNLNPSSPTLWHTTQTRVSPVTSVSLQKIINDVNVEPNVTGRRSTPSTTTSIIASPTPPSANITGIKRKRESSPDIEIVEIPSLPPPNKKRDKGKGKAKAVSVSPTPSQPPLESAPTTPPQTQTQTQSQSQPQNQEEPLSEYTCPICFFPPSNATLTPCGHVCCGSCLFTAVKTTLQRGVSMGMMMGAGENVARCPVCRAAIPGWDGKGGGVIGIKVRQIISL